MPIFSRREQADQIDPRGYERHTVETRQMEIDPVPENQTNINVQPAPPAYPLAGRVGPSDSAIAASRLIGVIYLLFGIVETIIFIRFLLRALAANSAAGFAQLIYGLSGPFVAPFQGLLGQPALGGAVFEFSSLIAIIIYALVSVGIARLIRIVFIDQPVYRR